MKAHMRGDAGGIDVIDGAIETRDSCIAWFCIRSQPKHELVAAKHLEMYDDVEVFNPRIRFRRKAGAPLITESLFPNYLFARFDWRTSLAKVHYSHGVSEVVHFGTRWPTLSDEAIDTLRTVMGPEGIRPVPVTLQPGDLVDVTCGAFHGLQAVISKVMPGQQRVIVLMDILGRQTSVELDSGDVEKQ